jgi:hypothetical protein
MSMCGVVPARHERGGAAAPTSSGGGCVPEAEPEPEPEFCDDDPGLKLRDVASSNESASSEKVARTGALLDSGAPECRRCTTTSSRGGKISVAPPAFTTVLSFALTPFASLLITDAARMASSMPSGSLSSGGAGRVASSAASAASASAAHRKRLAGFFSRRRSTHGENDAGRSSDAGMGAGFSSTWRAANMRQLSSTNGGAPVANQ